MIDYYLGLLADSERIEAFERAIREQVRPDDVVVDLGCGVGTYAIFAARAGARRVFGVESSAVIDFARELVRDNEVQVELISGDARDVRLPEAATLLIFEDFPVHLVSETIRGQLEGVVARWMVEGFRVIPESAALNAAPVSSRPARQCVNPWGGPGERDRAYGLDLSALLASSRNTAHAMSLSEDTELLAEPALLFAARLDEPLPGRWSRRGSFEIERRGEIAGICLWHDLVLCPGEVYSNRPDSAGTRTWGQLLLPVPEPWPTRAGDRLEYDLAYEPAGGDGLWRWELRLVAWGGVEQQRCAANSFAGLPMSRERLEGFRPDGVVRLRPGAELEAQVLSLVDGERTLGEIVDELERLRPELPSALEVVLRLLEGRRDQEGV